MLSLNNNYKRTIKNDENYSIKSEHSCSTGTSKNTMANANLSHGLSNDHEHTSQSLEQMNAIDVENEI